MSDDFTKPDVCICDEQCALAIADWGRKAISAREALAIAVGFLECIFRDRNHMVKHKMELKFHLRSSLSEEKQQILTTTDKFLNKKGQTDEQKAQMQERRKIGASINRLYLELLNATFPVDDGMILAIDAIDAIDENEVAQETRPRYPPKMEPVDHDLFETPRDLLHLLGDVVATIRENGWTVFEPCAGNDAIVDYLTDYGINVIARDKYTKEISHDLLKDPMPDGVDIIITNPPFNLKFEILARLVEYGKPFILLLPFETSTTKTFHRIVGDTKFDLLVPSGRSRFLHAGAFRDVGPTAWYVFSPASTGSVTFKPLGAKDDVELVSEDTEGGRDYDSDGDEEVYVKEGI